MIIHFKLNMIWGPQGTHRSATWPLPHSSMLNSSTSPTLSKNSIETFEQGTLQIQNKQKNPMSEFTEDFLSNKPSLPFLDIDQNMEPTNQYADQFNIPSVVEYPSLNFHTYMPFSNDTYLFSNQEPEFPAGNMIENFPKLQVHSIVTDGNESKKRIAVDDATESSSGISTPPVSETGVKRKNVTI